MNCKEEILDCVIFGSESEKIGLKLWFFPNLVLNILKKNAISWPHINERCCFEYSCSKSANHLQNSIILRFNQFENPPIHSHANMITMQKSFVFFLTVSRRGRFYRSSTWIHSLMFIIPIPIDLFHLAKKRIHLNNHSNVAFNQHFRFKSLSFPSIRFDSNSIIEIQIHSSFNISTSCYRYIEKRHDQTLLFLFQSQYPRYWMYDLRTS